MATYARTLSSQLRIGSAGIPRAMTTRAAAVARRRMYATEHPPSPTPPPPKPQPQTKAGAFYKSFGSPVVKCFLGALFTYQVAYWGWMKLESLEEKTEYEDEIRDLKDQLRAEVVKKIEAGKEKVEDVVSGNSKESATHEKKKKGWLW